MANFDVTKLSPSFSVGSIRADVTYRGSKRFDVELYAPHGAMSHEELLCAIKVLKRAEKFVAAHAPND